MISFPDDISIEGYRFIVPSVAVANLAQLCVDLLISAGGLEKIGQCWNVSFLPVVGQNPYNSESDVICTAADFYVDKKHQLVILQLRSPYVGNSLELFEELARFIKDRKISKTIILTSGYDYELSSAREDRADARIVESSPEDPETSTELQTTTIPGGGFACSLFSYLKGRKLSCAVVYRYCAEGDNVSDALDFTGRLNKKLLLIPDTEENGLPKGLRFPPSWQHLFGNPPPVELY